MSLSFVIGGTIDYIFITPSFYILVMFAAPTARFSPKLSCISISSFKNIGSDGGWGVKKLIQFHQKLYMVSSPITKTMLDKLLADAP